MENVAPKVVTSKVNPNPSPKLMTPKVHPRPFTVIVEGNIGSGKTTFLSHFSRHIAPSNVSVDILTEPVDKWRNIEGHNLLQLMYEDPSRWSLAFQSYAQLTMMQNHVKKTNAPVKLMERSIYSGRRCFIENLYRTGKLPGSEYSVLDEWFRFLTSGGTLCPFDLGVDLVVYLRTTPEVAWERVRARARSEEMVIPIEYLRVLHELHEEWLMSEVNQSKVPAKVLVVDADQDINEVPERFTEYVEEIVETFKRRKEKEVPMTNNTVAKKVLGVVNR